jgi:prophage DNA circulation protein
MSDLARTVAAFSYEGVVFPGTDTSVKWGHDKATHQGYLQRGAVIETTGQRARVITVRVPLRNSLRWTGSATRLYPETYLALREKLKQAEGFLTHPTYGSIVVHVDDVDENVDPLRPDGLDLTLPTAADAPAMVAQYKLNAAAVPPDMTIGVTYTSTPPGIAVYAYSHI